VVHTRNKTPFAEFKCQIQGSYQAKIFFVFTEYDPGVAVRSNYITAAIGTCVVNNQKFEVAEGLVQNTVNSFAQVFLRVKNRQYYRQFRAHFLFKSLLMI